MLRYCGSDEVHGDILRKKVVAPGNTMLFVLTTDDDENFGDLAIKYYAVPGVCRYSRSPHQSGKPISPEWMTEGGGGGGGGGG